MGLGLEPVLAMKIGFGLGIRTGLNLWVELGYGQGWVWFGDEVRDGAEFGVRSEDDTGVVLEDRGGVKDGVEIAGDLWALTLPWPGFLKPVHCSPLEVHIPPFLRRCPCSL